MSKYPDEILRNGLPFDFVSSHESQIKAKIEVFHMKRKTKTNFWGVTSKVNISTRIIKAKDGRYLIYYRET